MNRLIHIISFLIYFTTFSFGQVNIIDSLFMEFKNDIEIEQQVNEGRVVWDKETRLTYYLLLKTAPIDSLIKLTNDSNPAIRSEVFMGLYETGA